MKKNKLVILIVLITIFVALPKNVMATTLKEYEDLVVKYTAELKEKESRIAKSKEEVAEVKKNISSIESQISEVENEIKKIEEEIDISNKEIAKKKDDSKKIMKYFQVVNSGNTYLEYIFEATSITDMIYRISVVEQLGEYNQEVVDELTKLIKENERKKEELATKKNDLSELRKKLQRERERIEKEINTVEGTLPSTKGQIKFYQERVNYYKNKGCKSNDVIGVTCDIPKKVTSSSKPSAGAIIGANGFRFPVNGGRITQNYGNAGHKGVDIGKGCGAPIYAVAAGKVYYVGSDLDAYGAKTILIAHNVNGKLVFSQYAHLQGYNVSNGQDVNTDTIIGYMGNTGYSFGCHLHLEMSENYGWAYNATYSKYTKNIINPFKYVPRP